jgi:hypothetical protein
MPSVEITDDQKRALDRGESITVEPPAKCFLAVHSNGLDVYALKGCTRGGSSMHGPGWVAVKYVRVGIKNPPRDYPGLGFVFADKHYTFVPLDERAIA